MVLTKLLTSLIVLIPAAFAFRDNDVVPVWTDVPSSLAAGQNGTVTVGFNKTASSDTTVSISTSAPSDLTVPSSTTLHSGESQVQFQITMNRNATDGGTVTATANGTQSTSSKVSLTTPAVR